jgi:hypothetical protein
MSLICHNPILSVPPEDQEFEGFEVELKVRRGVFFKKIPIIFKSSKISKFNYVGTKIYCPLLLEYFIKTSQPLVVLHRRKELVGVIIVATFLVLSSWKDGKR